LGWFEKVLAIREKILGPDDPNLNDTYNNMAACCYKTGDIKKALEVFLRAYRIRYNSLGRNHKVTAATLMALEKTYMANFGSEKDFRRWLNQHMREKENTMGFTELSQYLMDTLFTDPGGFMKLTEQLKGKSDSDLISWLKGKNLRYNEDEFYAFKAMLND